MKSKTLPRGAEGWGSNMYHTIIGGGGFVLEGTCYEHACKLALSTNLRLSNIPR